jgi:hypothetical protein
MGIFASKTTVLSFEDSNENERRTTMFRKPGTKIALGLVGGLLVSFLLIQLFTMQKSPSPQPQVVDFSKVSFYEPQFQRSSGRTQCRYKLR